MSQLTLVEHALCPLDRETSLQRGLQHACAYPFMDAAKQRAVAHAQVAAGEGLSAYDEFFLWGLLGITFSQSPLCSELHVTPHYCLRQLGLVETSSKGGASYRHFREAIRRLSAVRYQNDCFFDPLLREHRQVSFGFFSYSLPVQADSRRAWRIAWDPLFFELCQASGSQLGFDLSAYRQLEPASRRLYLLLQKVFWRREWSPWFDVRQLAVDVLGFSTGLEDWRLKQRVQRCATRLARLGVVQSDGDDGCRFEPRSAGGCSVRFGRGPNVHRQKSSAQRSVGVADSPLVDPLRSIGLDESSIKRVLSRYSPPQVRLWSDVTLAAMEHKGTRFFHRSPQAFLLDNLKHATTGRTAPDWFVALRKREEQGPTRPCDNLAQDGERRSGLTRAIEPSDVMQVVQSMFGREAD